MVLIVNITMMYVIRYQNVVFTIAMTIVFKGGLATLVYSDKGGYLDLAVYFIEIVGVNVNAADEVSFPVKLTVLILTLMNIQDDDNIVNLCSNHTPFDHNVPVFRYFLSQGFNIHYISKVR